MNEILDQLFWGNSVRRYLFVAGSLLFSYGMMRLMKNLLLRWLKKLVSLTAMRYDDLLLEALGKYVFPFLYLTANYYILMRLHLDEKVARILSAALAVALFYFSVKLLNFLLKGFAIGFMEDRKEPQERIDQMSGMFMVIKIMMWGVGAVILVDNLGYDVTTIIAGLGVGGIAIALAAQNILGDLFSYLVIFFDKPFETGDFIVAGSNVGTVEKIGIKTSHIRSLDGQQMVMPNAELVKTVIHNYKRFSRRRVVFTVGVVYYTSADKLKKVPCIISQLIQKNPHATFDRAHLKSFGDSSINFEIVYYLESVDYLFYMDTHQEICYDLFETFELEGIEFAFPTQTLFIKNEENGVHLGT